MKLKNLLFLCLSGMSLFLLSHPVLGADDQKNVKVVTISFNLHRIPGPGSNQMAVWIENEKGEYIRSVYATKYTARGGYVRRPVSLSVWRSKASWEKASPEEIDAVSGSTLEAGIHTLTWDGKDKNGNLVPDGKYYVRIEANILNEKKMFSETIIEMGGRKQSVKGNITYSQEGLESGNQIFDNVLVEYK